MYKRIFIGALLVLLHTTVKSQPALDTIKDCLKQRPTVFVKLDSRNSFISNSRAKIFGIKLGLNYGKRVHAGVGYNQLYPPAKDFNKQVYYINSIGLRDSVTSRLRLYYVAAYVEYIFYQTKRWELSMPLQFGIGRTFYKYEWYGEKRVRDESLNLIYEPAVSVEYKFIKWVGVGADIGFRFMITGDRRLYPFNSPTYAFKILIYYNELYKTFKNKKK